MAAEDSLANAMRYSIFVSNLEKWIDSIIMRDGMADKELIKTIKERFDSSIQANVDYHRLMMKNAKENNDLLHERRHRLLAEVYQSLGS